MNDVCTVVSPLLPATFPLHFPTTPTDYLGLVRWSNGSSLSICLRISRSNGQDELFVRRFRLSILSLLRANEGLHSRGSIVTYPPNSAL